MSNPGPYQSRLFNFLVPQYRQLREKGDRVIRQMKIAVSWTAQVVLYPVYLLLQTTRLAAHKLGQAVKEKLPQLQGGSGSDFSGTVVPDEGADRPLKQVLLAAQTEELLLTPDLVPPESPKPSLSPHGDLMGTPKPQGQLYSLPNGPQMPEPRVGDSRQVIRGIATQLASKSLVLVTPENQELDSLTSSEQQKLRQLIIWEVANYWRRQRQRATAERPPSWQMLASKKEIIPPIRLLGQVMAWEQKGTVAQAIDLFGESSLVLRPRTESVESKIEKNAIAFFSKLDSSIAALETGQLDIIGSGRTKIQQKIREITYFSTESVTNATEPSGQKILAWLQAAIEHFFGSKENTEKLSGEATVLEVEVKQLTESQGSQTSSIQQQKENISEGPKPAQDLYLPDPQGRSPGALGESVKNWIWRYLQRPKTGRVAEVESPSTRSDIFGRVQSLPQGSAAPTAESEQTMLVRTANRDKLSGPEPEENIYIDTAPEWIEIVATPTGYVKHPLESILDWLDLGVLWLEEKAIGVWKWLWGE